MYYWHPKYQPESSCHLYNIRLGVYFCFYQTVCTVLLYVWTQNSIWLWHKFVWNVCLNVTLIVCVSCVCVECWMNIIWFLCSRVCVEKNIKRYGFWYGFITHAMWFYVIKIFFSTIFFLQSYTFFRHKKEQNDSSIFCLKRFFLFSFSFFIYLCSHIGGLDYCKMYILKARIEHWSE